MKEENKALFTTKEIYLINVINNLVYGIKQVCDPDQYDDYIEQELGIDVKILNLCEKYALDFELTDKETEAVKEYFTQVKSFVK